MEYDPYAHLKPKLTDKLRNEGVASIDFPQDPAELAACWRSATPDEHSPDPRRMWVGQFLARTLAGEPTYVIVLSEGPAEGPDPESPHLNYTAGEWEAFVSGAKGGEFDH